MKKLILRVASFPLILFVSWWECFHGKEKETKRKGGEYTRRLYLSMYPLLHAVQGGGLNRVLLARREGLVADERCRVDHSNKAKRLFVDNKL